MSERSPRITREQVEAAGQRITYRVGGEGDPIVLVHGLSGSTWWWTRNVRALAKSYQVFLVDLPGFGAMRRPFSLFSLAEATSWLMAWMKAVDLERVHLVGHSMGGYVSIRLAATAPEVVRRLVLVAPAGLRMRRSHLGYITPLFRAVRNTTPFFLPLLAHDALRAGPLTLWSAARDLLAGSVQEDLASITAPCLLIFGEKDSLIPPSLGPIMREMISGSRLVVMRDVGHVPMFDRPREFNAAVLDFLEGRQVGD